MNDDPNMEWRDPHGYKLRHDPQYKKLFDDLEFERRKKAVLEDAKKSEPTAPPAPASYSAEEIHALLEGTADAVLDVFCDIFHQMADILSGKTAESKGKLATALRDMFKPLLARIEAIESGLKAAKDAIVTGGIRYRGVFDSQIVYRQGDIVTLGGSGWVSLADSNKTRPGDTGNRWQLFVKAGRDGRA